MEKSKSFCEKCNKNPIGARFLGKDICGECWDKAHDIIYKVRTNTI